MCKAWGQICHSLVGDQAAELYAELDTHDKQRLQIALLVHDNDQLQIRLAAAEKELQHVRISEAAAQEAWKAAEFQLTQSQVSATILPVSRPCPPQLMILV